MKILLAVSGGVATYKVCELLRLLKSRGHLIRVVMTSNAQGFVSPMTFQALGADSVHTELFDMEQERAMGHIALAKWPDKIIIAPATANCIAKLAHGLADDLLSTLCLVTQSPIYIVPAMNESMWFNDATQANVALLKKRDNIFFGPASGEQACGDVGWGRMLAPDEIIDALFTKNGPEHKGHVLITAGPTQEALDPVRVISNRSSGKMGYALAAAFLRAGWQVTLVSGPTALSPPIGVEFYEVETTDEMYKAVLKLIEKVDMFISAAAVCDYQPEKVSELKIKKSDAGLAMRFKPTIDILRTISFQHSELFKVGFALETNNLESYAREKLKSKDLNMLIANKAESALGTDHAAVKIFLSGYDGTVIHFNPLPKAELAEKLSQTILTEYKKALRRRERNQLQKERA